MSELVSARVRECGRAGGRAGERAGERAGGADGRATLPTQAHTLKLQHTFPMDRAQSCLGHKGKASQNPQSALGHTIGWHSSATFANRT